MELFSRVIESALQTTMVSPGFFASSADARERALGTLPPAHGLTWQSAFGFGQYDGRSTWACAADVGIITSAARARMVARRFRTMRRTADRLSSRGSSTPV